MSRLLNEKGFAEYCEIANLLKEDSSFKFISLEIEIEEIKAAYPMINLKI